MIKSLFFLGLFIVGGYFAINKIPALHDRVIEVINPAAKEARLINELDANLNKIQSGLGEIAGAQVGSIQSTQIAKAKALISQSKSLLGDIQKTNSDNSGLAKSILNKITSTLFDSTPYPAEDLTTSKPAATQIICPTPTK